jgi:hypothetical protein
VGKNRLKNYHLFIYKNVKVMGFYSYVSSNAICPINKNEGAITTLQLQAPANSTFHTAFPFLDAFL